MANNIVKAPKFKGTTKEDVESFLTQMELRFNGAGVTDEIKKVQMVCQCLQGNAAVWVAALIKKWGPTKLVGTPGANGQPTAAWTSYADFQQFLRMKHGKHYDITEDAEQKIFNIRQGRAPVMEFNTEFDKLRAVAHSASLERQLYSIPTTRRPTRQPTVSRPTPTVPASLYTPPLTAR